VERSISDSTHRLSESENLTPSLILSPSLRIAIIMFITLTIVNLGARELAQRTESAPNPLAPLADVLPGYPENIAERLGFSCLLVDHHHLSSPQEACAARLATGAFERAGVAVSRDKIIYEVAFMVRGDALQLGDLMMILGRPEINRYDSVTIFRWLDGSVTAIARDYKGQFSPSAFLPVQNVSFTNPQLPGCDCS
jgi:hypothetical protein